MGVNMWLGSVFGRDNIDETVAESLASQGETGRAAGDREAMRARLTNAEARLPGYSPT